MNKPKTIFCDLDGTLVKHSNPVEIQNPDLELEVLPGVHDKLREKSIKLIKLYSAVAIAKESGSIVERKSLITTLINFLSELNVRFYIVKNYNKSYIRFVLYYFILMLRIILKMLFGKR